MKKLSNLEMKKVNGGSWFNLTRILIGTFGGTFLAGFFDGIFRPFRCR